MEFMTKEIAKKLEDQDWYQHWFETARAIVWQTLRNSRMMLIEGKWKLGEHIESHMADFNRSQIYGEKISEKIAGDLHISKREVDRCRQFYKYCIKKFEAKDWDRVSPNLPEEKQISWNQIKTLWLPEPKQKEIPLPKGKYNVILADPPWAYRNTGVEGAVENEYPTMPIEDLCKMLVKSLAAENAIMFLWTTNPILEECFPVISAWGFEYKTNLCWVKMNKNTGIGFYVRGIHELLLICTRGQMLPVYKPLSVIREDAKGHSTKPEVHGLIEKMYPDCKYLELFARNNKKRKNWSYWGDQANT